MLSRPSAVTPPWAQMNRNFSHRSTWTWVESSAWIPAPFRTPRMRSTRGVALPSFSPSLIVRGPAVWLMTPGALMVERMWTTPAITCSSPRMAASFSSLSTPFSRHRTTVWGPIVGRTCAPAASVS